jgi:hypothetical protein
MNGSTYVLDANIFIEAARRYYAFDLAPMFWEILDECAKNESIYSIDRIKKELGRGKDELAEWAKSSYFSHAFASTDETDIIETYTDIMIWVNEQSQFSDAAKADFADSADGWLVAYAKVKGHVVVTHEVPAPDARRKVPIPNVCEEFDVRYVDTFTMLRELGVRFA